jgi:hypothetical protein
MTKFITLSFLALIDLKNHFKKKYLFHHSCSNLNQNKNNKIKVDFTNYDKNALNKLNININYINPTHKKLQQFEDIEYNFGDYVIYPEDPFKTKEQIEYNFTDYSIDSNISYIYDNNLH